MKGTFSEIISVFYLYVVLVCKPGQLSRQHYQIYVIFVLRNLKSVREDNSAKMLFFPEIKKGKVERWKGVSLLTQLSAARIYPR